MDNLMIENTVKRVTDLSPSEAQSFFLKEESYINFKLPPYFSFKEVLAKLSKALKGKSLSTYILRLQFANHEPTIKIT